MFLKGGVDSAIRPYEITLLVLYEIDKCLNKYDYEEIEISENKINILIKAKKIL